MCCRNDDDDTAIFVTLMVFVVIFGIGAAGAGIWEYRWRAECVRRGVAEYNSRTGEWQWKKP